MQIDPLDRSAALFSDDRVYRYGLHRIWDDRLDQALFVMLNPSTANDTEDDPTVRCCEQFARSWGYGSVAIANLFSLRSTNPKALYDHPDPVGPDTDHHLLRHARMADLIVCAWGNHGGRRGLRVWKMLTANGLDLHCLGLNKTGQPVHPLYQPKRATPVPFPYNA